jgi:insulysin
LDRFAQFFIAPLFLADCTDRELKAVDSEFKGSFQSDFHRLECLERSLSNPEYPYNCFSCGNLVSLKEEPEKKGLQVRDAFIQFHEQHYSANLMRLVVLGRESLDELQQWVVQKFSDVPDKNLLPPDFEGTPYTDKEMQVRSTLLGLVCLISDGSQSEINQRFTFLDSSVQFPGSTSAHSEQAKSLAK